MDTYKVEGAKCTKATEKALLIEAPEFEQAVWVPQSQVTDDSEVYKLGDDGVLIVSLWFATQKGWV